MTFHDVLTYGLMGTSVLMFAAAGVFLSYGVYQNFIVRFLSEVRDESSGVKGLGSVTIRKLGSFNRRLMWPGYEARMRRRLVKAGEPFGFKPEDIMVLQEVSGIIGLLAGLVLMNGLQVSLLFAVFVMLFGAWYPLIWVGDQVKKRHLLISRALPYNLDLLTLSVEAGLDFTAALAKVVEKGKPGPLREELQLVLKQLKMGKTREEALKSMIARVDLPALSTFVTALVQADKMGTSLGKVLRIQSTQLRVDRSQRAEKLAAEAPVKMLFPLIACIFPTVFLVLFGPIVFQYMFTDLLK